MGHAGRPVGSTSRPKRVQAALVRLLGEDGTNPKLLEKIALAQSLKAAEGDTAAAQWVADRLDGKVPQALVGDSEHDPIAVTRIEREIIETRVIEMDVLGGETIKFEGK